MRLFRFGFEAMASRNELQLWADAYSAARRAADAAIAEVRRIERKYSRYRDDSLTTRINRAAGGAAVAIDGETAALLAYADRCHRASAGLFDLTSGVLRRAWNFRSAAPSVPDARSLEGLLALVGWSSVEWDEHSIRLPRPGMEIDFGGIGKEYAADRAATVCTAHGVASALVNLGGDVRSSGPPPDGTLWRIAVRHPRVDGAAVASVEVGEGAVATSGDYERFFELDGRRYCHILDPRTGMPVGHWQSVTVVGPLCVLAGSHATIAMLLGDGAAAFLADERVAWIAVDADGNVQRGSATARPVRT